MNRYIVTVDGQPLTSPVWADHGVDAVLHAHDLYPNARRISAKLTP